MSIQKAANRSKADLRKVPFTARIEGAREVVVTGDFTQWAPNRVRLTYAGDGEWQAELRLARGEYQYRLIVDGEWRDDPTSIKRVPNPFGTENCVLTVE